MPDERKTKAQLIAELNDLRRREIEYRSLFEDNPQPMWVYDRATLAFLAVNDAAVGHYGYSRAEFLRLTIADIHLSADVPLLLNLVHELPGPYRAPGVWQQQKKHGELIDVEITTHDIVFDGKAARLVLANDVTVRQQTERSRRYQAALVNNAAEAIIATDEKLNIQVWNAAAEQIYGWRAREALDQPIDQIIPGEFPGTRVEAVRQQLEREGRWQGEIIQRRKDGSPVHVLASTAQLRDSDGRLFSTITINHDITARKQAEEQLHFQASLLEHLHNAVIVIDAQLTITFWNHHATTLYQWPAQEAVGRNAIALLVRDEDVAQVTQIIANALPYGYWEGDFTLRRKDGSTFPAHITGAILTDSHGEMIGLVGVSEDITARQQMEFQREAALAALRDSEVKFRSFVEQSSEGVVLLNEEGRVIEWNPAQEQITGILRTQAIDLPFWELQYQVRPPELRPPRGPEFFKEALLDALRTGQAPLPSRPIDIEIQTVSGERKFIQQTAFPIKTALGFWIGGIFRDVTERKQVEAELRNSEMRLRQISRQLLQVHETERHAIARELHDDIGQALTAIKLDLQTAQRAAGATAVMARLDDSIATVEHALQAVRHLSLDLRPLLLDDLGLAAALRWYVDRQAQRAGLTAQVDVDTLVLRPAPEIETICFRVAQEALTNIVRHAQAQQITVALRQTDSQLEMIIHDDGRGFDVNAARARALHGASLGLLSMEERVMLGQGHLKLESVPGQGTTIHVWLPLADRLDDGGAVG
ncbi:Signal transduction histidine-protein kinase/phosphatase DegS [Thermoflexales bacterium]|nr:Signal transduction histidine-protein kinase/phosphatase DegS [Thermoflexales bacterium]